MSGHEGHSTEWEWGRFLGRGSYGSVFLAFEKKDTKRVPWAVKVFDLREDTTPAQCKILLQEVTVMKSIPWHKRVVQCVGSMFDQRGKLCIVMEFMGGGTLGALLRSRKRLDNEMAAVCVKQVLEGVSHLHKHSIFHRDLKGDNILVRRPPSGEDGGELHEPPQLKLADFGNSKMKEEYSATIVATTAKTVAGTALWMAPEVIRAAQMQKGYSPSKADLWSVGIVACEILQQGRAPWPTFDNAVQALFTIGQWSGGNSGRALPPESPSHISQECSNFLALCMAVDPDERPSASKLLEHVWVKRVSAPEVAELTQDEIGDSTVHETTRLLPVSEPSVLRRLCADSGEGDQRQETQGRRDGEPDFIKTAIWSTITMTTMTDPPAEPEPEEVHSDMSDESDEGETVDSGEGEEGEEGDDGETSLDEYEEEAQPLQQQQVVVQQQPEQEGQQHHEEEEACPEEPHKPLASEEGIVHVEDVAHDIASLGSGLTQTTDEAEKEFFSTLRDEEEEEEDHSDFNYSFTVTTSEVCAPNGSNSAQVAGRQATPVGAASSSSAFSSATPDTPGKGELEALPNGVQWVPACSPKSPGPQQGLRKHSSPAAATSPSTPVSLHGYQFFELQRLDQSSGQGRGHRRSLPPAFPPESRGRGHRQRQCSVTVLSGMPGLPEGDDIVSPHLMSPVPEQQQPSPPPNSVKALRLRFSGTPNSPAHSRPDRSPSFSSATDGGVGTPHSSSVSSPKAIISPLGGSARVMGERGGVNVQHLKGVFEHTATTPPPPQPQLLTRQSHSPHQYAHPQTGKV